MPVKEDARKEHAYKVWDKQLRAGDVPPVVFLYGDESYLIHWVVQSLVKKFVSPGSETLDYVQFFDDGEDARTIIDACNTFSMASDRRVVWARNFPPLWSLQAKGFGKQDLALIDGYIQAPNPATVLVFSNDVPPSEAVARKKSAEKDASEGDSSDEDSADGASSATRRKKESELTRLLKKKAACYEFGPVDRATLAGFIKKRFRGAGMEPSRALLAAIVEESGYLHKETTYRLYDLLQDVGKIIAYSAGGPVDITAATELLHGAGETFIFELLDAVCNRQKNRAFEILQTRRALYDPAKDTRRVLSMVVSQFELILDVKELQGEGMSRAQISKFLSVHEFRVKKVETMESRWETSELRRTLSMLYEAQRNLVSGLLDVGTSLEMIIAQL